MAELCRRGCINSNVYYRWGKEFLEAGKRRISGDTAHEATSDEVNGSNPLWYCQIKHCIF